MQFEKLGDFRAPAVGDEAKKNVATGPVESLFGKMDYLALLVVGFLPEKMDPSERPTVYPSEEELQDVVVEEVGGER